MSRRSAAGFFLILALLSACDGSPDELPNSSDLLEALTVHRLTTPRLTGHLYQPCVEPLAEPSSFCTPPPEPGDRAWEGLNSTVAAVRERGRQALDSEDLHVRGICHLVWHKAERAVAEMEGARALAPADPAVLNDLGVALWLRGNARQDPRDLASALAAFEQAGSLPEALFNRSLLLSHLGLRRSGLEAWNTYEKIDSGSPWAEEGQERRRRLQSRVVPPWEEQRARLQQALLDLDASVLDEVLHRYPQEVYDYGDRDLLGGWARAMVGDEGGAAVLLEQIHHLAEARERVFGDRQLVEAVALIERALESPQEPLLELLIGGHRELAVGLDAIAKRDFSAASRALRQARRWLKQAASPHALLSELELLRCLYQESKYSEVSARAEKLHNEVSATAWPNLKGRSLWVQGSSLLSLGRSSEALRAYQRSMMVFKKSGDAVHQGILHVLVASAYGELGDLETAWYHRLQALQKLAGREADRWLGTAVAEAVYGALQLHEPLAALALQDEALALARDAEDPLVLVIALRHRVNILRHLGHATEAFETLAEAIHQAHEITDPNRQRRAIADLRWEEAQLLRILRPAEAILRLSEVLEEYRRGEFEVLVPWVLHERALAKMEVADIQGAEEDLVRALDHLDHLRSHRRTHEHRLPFVDGFQVIYSDLASLQIDRGRETEDVLDTLERSRARLLLDRLGGGLEIEASTDLPTVFRVRPVRELKPALPPDTAFVLYHWVRDGLVIALLRGSGPEIIEAVPGDAVRLRSMIEKVAGIRLLKTREITARLTDLHQVLIEPISKHLVAGETLVLIPQDALYALPFGALIDPSTGRYLSEDHTLVIVPSLNVFERLWFTKKRAEPLARSALILADPAFDQELFPSIMDRLPGANLAGTEIHRLLPSSILLRGGQATRRAFLDQVGHHEITHVGAHGIANPTSSLRSRLALAPSGKDSGVLHAEELLRVSLAETRLVVLAACQSAGAGPMGSEGAAGLVWPLLAGGVPQIVATVQRVDDDESSALMVDFYRHLAASGEPLTALKAAQLDAIEASRGETRPSLTWAAFQLYGVPLAFEP